MIRGAIALALTVALGRDAAADEKAPPVAARHADGSEPYWLTYAAFRNDAFTELIPPLDDQGFTHDNVFALRRQTGSDTFGGSFVHRIITSNEDRRRWDLVELFATAERDWLVDGAHGVHVAAIVRAGPTLGGNWGGRYLQNGWHTISKTGPTIDEGLANDYPDGRSYAFTAGSRAIATIGDRLQGYSYIDGQLALGQTGVTSMQAVLGSSATSRHVGAHAEVALAGYHVNEPYLALPGGYGNGFQFEWRLGVEVHWSRFRVGYEYRANEGGSGEPLGMIEFSSTR